MGLGPAPAGASPPPRCPACRLRTGARRSSEDGFAEDGAPPVQPRLRWWQRNALAFPLPESGSCRPGRRRAQRCGHRNRQFRSLPYCPKARLSRSTSSNVVVDRRETLPPPRSLPSALNLHSLAPPVMQRSSAWATTRFTSTPQIRRRSPPSPAYRRSASPPPSPLSPPPPGLPVLHGYPGAPLPRRSARKAWGATAPRAMRAEAITPLSSSFRRAPTPPRQCPFRARRKALIGVSAPGTGYGTLEGEKHFPRGKGVFSHAGHEGLYRHAPEAIGGEDLRFKPVGDESGDRVPRRRGVAEVTAEGGAPRLRRADEINGVSQPGKALATRERPSPWPPARRPQW